MLVQHCWQLAGWLEEAGWQAAAEILRCHRLFIDSCYAADPSAFVLLSVHVLCFLTLLPLKQTVNAFCFLWCWGTSEWISICPPANSPCSPHTPSESQSLSFSFTSPYHCLSLPTLPLLLRPQLAQIKILSQLASSSPWMCLPHIWPLVHHPLHASLLPFYSSMYQTWQSWVWMGEATEEGELKGLGRALCPLRSSVSFFIWQPCWFLCQHIPEYSRPRRELP